MTTPITISEIMKDADFASRINFPNNISCFLIYRGSDKLEYALFDSDVLIFSGSDYKPSPLHSIDGIQSIIGLLSFLTTKKGDTDDEYFKEYTPAQIEFSESEKCEYIRLLIYDYEDTNSSYHSEAMVIINNCFKYGE